VVTRFFLHGKGDNNRFNVKKAMLRLEDEGLIQRARGDGSSTSGS
jgi:DNA-binding GntR family transcriptional regulator